MIAGIACQILVQLVIMSLQFVAGGAILSALLPDFFTPLTGMLISAVVFIGITLIGGMWSASQSNLLNVTLQYIGITVASWIIVQLAGGMTNVALHMPSIHSLDFISGVGGMTITTWIVVLITVNLSSRPSSRFPSVPKTSAPHRKASSSAASLCSPSASSPRSWASSPLKCTRISTQPPPFRASS